MAVQSAPIWDETWKAGASQTTKQHYAMKLSAKNTVVICAAAADVCIGILQNAPDSGQAAVVRHLGKTKAVVDGSGAAISVGDRLGPNSSGKLVKKATGDYSICAIANDASSADGDEIEVLFIGPGVWRTLGG